MFIYSSDWYLCLSNTNTVALGLSSSPPTLHTTFAGSLSPPHICHLLHFRPLHQQRIILIIALFLFSRLPHSLRKCKCWTGRNTGMSAHSLFLSFSLPSCSLLYAKCACVKTCGAASNSSSKDGDLGRQTDCRPTYSSFPCHGRQHVSVLLYCCTAVLLYCRSAELWNIREGGERGRAGGEEKDDAERRMGRTDLPAVCLFLRYLSHYVCHLLTEASPFHLLFPLHSLSRSVSLPIARSFAGRPHYLLVHKRSIVRVTALRITAKVEHRLHLNPHQQCLIPFPTPTPPPTPPVQKNMHRHLS